MTEINKQIIKEALGKITQGKWEDAVMESTEERAVYVADDKKQKVLEDGTISNSLVICKGMTGPNKINNAYFIASAPDYIRYLLSEVDTLQERCDALMEVKEAGMKLWEEAGDCLDDIVPTYDELAKVHKVFLQALTALKERDK